MAKHNKKQWRQYYVAKAKDPAPNALLKSALRKLPASKHKGLAIDVGCGTGADTLVLLKQGFEVLAIDAQAQAIQKLRRQVKLPFRKRLRTKIQTFEKLRKQDLAPAVFMNASFSMFFCRPSSYERFWRNLSGNLEEGGIFCGQFLGPRDDWADRRGYTAFSRAELEGTLFKDFTLLTLKEEEIDKHLRTGPMKHWHLFSVIAKKKKAKKRPRSK